MNNKQEIFVYALLDPRDLSIRYIGKTFDLARRLAEHIRANRGGGHCRNWIVHLKKLGLKPTMRILENTDNDTGNDREIWWIAKGRRLGWKLTNLTDGGDGGDAYWCNPERDEATEIARRKKISAGNKGKTVSAETRAKLSVIGKHRVFTPEHRRALSIGHTGKQHTEETKARMSEAKRGNRVWLGRKHTPETRKKMSEAAFRREAKKRRARL